MNESVNEKGLVPKLRFSEFSEKWKPQPLSSIVTIHKGRGISKAEVSLDGLSLCIRYGELYTRYGNLIDDVISRTSVPAEELFFSNAGDVIVPGSGETKEDIATAACVLRPGIALGGDINVLRGKSDGRWLSYYVNGRLKSEFAKIAQGDSVVHLYPGQIAAVLLAVPSIAEQRKIAECLQSLDELIAAETEKLEALKRHKKGLLQQLFPAEGETTPRLRFPQFRNSAEWDIRRLQEVCPFQRGFDLPSQDLRPGTVPVIYSNGERNTHEVGMAIGPGLLTGRSGTVGKLHFVLSGPYWAHNTTLWVTDFCNNDPQFIYFLLLTVGIEKYGSGSGVPTLNRNDLHDHLVVVPGIKEQKSIASALLNVAALIIATECSIVHLRAHKVALMQQLFPSLDELESSAE